MLSQEHLTRQFDLIPSNVLDLPITIIGAGAIGSFASLQLAKMGFTNQTVWDFDDVSIENMNCQFYRFKDIGKPKVLALQELVRDFTNEEITVVNSKWDKDAVTNGVVILAVDSMEVRKQIWNDIRQYHFTVKFLIDSRMGSEDALMYVMNPFDAKDVESYSKTLYSNAEAVAERCTAKATIYTANLLSGMVVKAIKDIATGGAYPRVTNWSIKSNHLMQWSK